MIDGKCPPWKYRIERPCMVIAGNKTEGRSCRYIVNPSIKFCEKCRRRFIERLEKQGLLRFEKQLRIFDKQLRISKPKTNK